MFPSVSDPDRPTCSKPGCQNKCKVASSKKRWRDVCHKHVYSDPSLLAETKRRHEKIRKPWIVFKKDFCEKCEFVAEHRCQLDVDHVDGDKKNNDPSNLMTLCANCHRLKTQVNKDYLKMQSRYLIGTID